MRKFVITIQFNGKNYNGWQKNSNSKSIQEIVENALTSLFSTPTEAIGASRTDSGVSAKEYPVCFVADTKLPTERIPFKLNRFLPKDVQAYAIREVSLDFNLRKSVTKKTYVYSFYVSQHVLPLINPHAYKVDNIDVQAIEKALSFLVGKHDLTSFVTVGGDYTTPIKNIFGASLEHQGVEYKIKICGDGFGYNTIRIIAGTLLKIGQSGQAEDFVKIMESKDRQNAGITLPPKGLVLESVEIEY
jgi:tRNA pseudouridine38-40 synthase